MASLPQIRRLVAEDFSDQKEWIRPMFQVLNQFMEGVVTGFSRTLTIKENMAADIKTAVLTSVPTASAPFTMAWGLPAPPAAIHIGNISGVTLTAAVQIQWAYGTAGLQITNIVGCTPTAANPATLTLTAFTG